MPVSLTRDFFLGEKHLWSEAVAQYISNIVYSFSACSSAALPQQSQKVSIWSLFGASMMLFVLTIFYLESICFPHCTDMTTMYTTFSTVKSTSFESGVHVLKHCEHCSSEILMQ